MPRSAQPSISILLPTFNGERYLAEQLDSILAQSWTDFELLVVDDGSSDQSLSILDRYAAGDARVKILPSQGNRGQKQRLSELLAVSRAPLIAVSDQDDIWARDKLETLLGALGECGLVFGRSELIDKNGKRLGRSLLEALRTPRRPDDKIGLLFRPQISGHAMLVRREVFPKEALESSEPYDWLISILAQFSLGIVYEDEAVTHHRLHTANTHNRAVASLINPLRLRPRHLLIWLGRAAKLRARLINGLAFLASSPLVPDTDRSTFGKLASDCRATWMKHGTISRRQLRKSLLNAFRTLSGSERDYQIAVDHVNLLTLGLLHPLTLIRVHRLLR